MRSKLKIIIIILGLATLAFSIPAYVSARKKAFAITGIKMAKGINEKFMPVEVTVSFPEGSTQVFCWFEWKNAKVNTPITASWDYTTDDIHILDYTFNIPRKKGSGSVSLTMPQGKVLPSGEYRISLKRNRRSLKSLEFRVE